MIPRFLTLIGLALLHVIVGFAFAQAAPLSPVVVQAGPATQWSVRIDDTKPRTERAPSEAASSDRRPVPVSLTMKIDAKGTRQGEVTFSDGHRQGFLAFNGSIFQKVPDGRVIRFSPGEMDPDNFDSLWVLGFPAVGWIAAEDFTGTEQIGERKYYVFHRGQETSSLGEPQQMKAWIDAETRHPFRVEIGWKTFLFSPVTPCSQSIEIPEDFVALATRIQKQNEALERIRKNNP